MKQSIRTAYFSPKQKGTIVEAKSVSFNTGQVSGKDSGVIIYDGNNNSYRFPFSERGKRGCLYGLKVYLEVTEKHTYLFYQGNETFVDKDARIIHGNDVWGQDSHDKLRAGFYLDDFEWEKGAHDSHSYSNTVIYGLNVRAFTMHRSSQVKKKGTFAGVCEKTPYLCDLGITALLLMPAYDFNEYETIIDKKSGNEIVRLNCWGFKESFYYAPKSSFAGDERPDFAFKSMVKTLHQNGLEVYMYFYFPPEFNRADILDILRFWVIEYHLDGFHLLGIDIPLKLITQDEVLSGTKIIYNEYAYWEEKPRYKNTGVFRDHFKTEVRRFLKGDEDKTNAFLYHHRNLPANRGSINYLANYDGFSLYDMTAYDQKRNEPNLEANHDGTNYNYSWNCGVEGPSRKKSIVALRTKQLKNALSLLLLSQGTPFIFSGDEFGNTRNGNNNAYCHDNETGWVKWPANIFGRELLSFTKELISFRKKHPLLHLPAELKLLDWKRCGFPDISYHGEEAFRPDLNPYSRTVGIKLCGLYAERENKQKDDFIFIAINMHWQIKSLALPNLPKDLSWCLVYSTDEREPKIKLSETVTSNSNKLSTKSENIVMGERSICVLISAPSLNT
ncbi:MAG: hypothetical protein FWE14_05570 [Lachnospiraceae bacterium]|nr:hypothetical protein [Lachnospiraceae bacterium]